MHSFFRSRHCGIQESLAPLDDPGREIILFAVDLETRLSAKYLTNISCVFAAHLGEDRGNPYRHNHGSIFLCWEDLSLLACTSICCSWLVYVNSLMEQFISKMGFTIHYQHCSHNLRQTILCKMYRKKITVRHIACEVTRPNSTWFIPVGFVKDQVCRTPAGDLANLQETIFILLSTMSHHRHFITLHNTWVEVEYHLDISCATNGKHVEV